MHCMVITKGGERDAGRLVTLLFLTDIFYKNVVLVPTRLPFPQVVMALSLKLSSL